MPGWVKIVGPIGIVVLLVLAGLIGGSIAKSGNKTDQEPSATATWSLEPPQVVGDLVRGDSTSTPDPGDPEKEMIRTNYSNGEDKVVLVLVRPQEELSSFLADAGVTTEEAVQDPSEADEAESDQDSDQTEEDTPDAEPEEEDNEGDSEAEPDEEPEPPIDKNVECGISLDTSTPVCAQLLDETVIMLGGLSGQSEGDLAELLVQFREELVQ